MDFLIFKSTSYLCAKKQTKISCAENYQDGDKNLTKLSQAVISEALSFIREHASCALKACAFGTN